MISLDRTGLRALLPNEAASQLVWAPGGRQLAYSRSVPGHADVVRIISMATHRSRTLAKGISPLWSPNGHELAFISVRPALPRMTLRVMALKSGRVRTLDSGEEISHAAWRPGGRSIAYAKRYRGKKNDLRTDIFAIDVKTRTRRALTHTVRNVAFDGVFWLPRRAALLYLRRLTG